MVDPHSILMMDVILFVIGDGKNKVAPKTGRGNQTRAQVWFVKHMPFLVATVKTATDT